MMLTSNFLSTMLVVLLSNPSGFMFNVAAHGAMESPQELARRAEFAAEGKRSLDNCAHKLQTRERIEQRLRRRDELIDQFLQEKKRDGVDISLNPALRKRDLSSQVDIPSYFTTAVCVLTPELTIGPYYAANQLIRPDMRETISGVELLLALEFIDVKTCEPIPNAMVDFWHCSNVGKYSAFAAEGTSGQTFLRGLQKTNADGIVTMTSIFPGWYAGRATHIHIAAHLGGTQTAAGYYSGGTSPHIGQLFFPEAVLQAIQKNSLYAANTNTRMLNTADGIYKQGAATGQNPEMTVHYINANNINSGIVGSIIVGIDTTKNYSMTSGGGAGGAPPKGAIPTDSNFTAPGNLTGNSTITGTAPPVSTTGGAVGSIANLFSLQGLGITSFLSVVFGFVVFNL